MLLQMKRKVRQHKNCMYGVFGCIMHSVVCMPIAMLFVSRFFFNFWLHFFISSPAVLSCRPICHAVLHFVFAFSASLPPRHHWNKTTRKRDHVARGQKNNILWLFVLIFIITSTIIKRLEQVGDVNCLLSTVSAPLSTVFSLSSYVSVICCCHH